MMTGIKLLVAAVWLMRCSEAIDLFLPLTGVDSADFEVRTQSLPSFDTNPNEIVYTITSYEGKNELITRVVFHNVEIFFDNTEHEPSVGRIVIFRFFRRLIWVSIMTVEGLNLIDEQSYYISENMLWNAMGSTERLGAILERRDRTPVGTMLSSILSRQSGGTKDSMDFEEVDDEPQLLRGSRDINLDELEKEIDEIMKNSGSAPVNISQGEAGGSN